MHQTRRGLAYVIAIVAIIAMPTVIMLSWYQFTRNPNLRPLGITREALREYGGAGAGAEIVAYIDTPSSRSESFAQRQLARDLQASFASKGVEVRVVFREAEGATRVTYVIGKSVLGPYPISRAGEGIAAAVEAFQMY